MPPNSIAPTANAVAAPAAYWRWANSRTSSSGFSTFSARSTNAVIIAKPATAGTRTRGLARVPALALSANPYVMPTAPPIASPRPSTSRRPASAVSLAGSNFTAATTAIAPSGRLIRKIQCQLATSISNPPMVGPKTGASRIGMPAALITRPRCLGPAALITIIWPTGITSPPPMPWSTRKAISELADQARAQSSEPSVKSSSEPI